MRAATASLHAAALLATTLFACAPAGNDGPDAGGPTASFTITGAVNASGAKPTLTAVALDEVLESYTRRRLTVTLTDTTGGRLVVVLTDSNGAPSTGEYVPFNSQQAISEASWKAGQVEYVSVGDPQSDTSTATLTALDWAKGGAVAGSVELTLADPNDATRTVRATATFEGALTGGP